MSNGETGKVLSFPARELSLQQGVPSTNTVSGKVHALIPKSLLKIFWERDTKPYSNAQDFFRVLFGNGHVTILCEDGDIRKDSILNVSDSDKSEYEITVGEFVRLTLPSPGTEVTEYDEYVLSRLAQLGISIGMRTEDISTTETVLAESEADLYKPEEILGALENGDFYSCEVYHKKDAPVGYGEPNIFDHQNHKITLLDIILSAIDDAEINGFDTLGASLEISFFEGSATIVTIIPFPLSEKVIYDAIKRRNALYQNLPYDKARARYFSDVVMPKLRSIDDESI